MGMEDINRELNYQHIAELHADAERYRQVRLSKRRRQRRSRGRLGRLLWPTGVAARANGIVGGIISPPWLRRARLSGRGDRVTAEPVGSRLSLPGTEGRGVRP